SSRCQAKRWWTKASGLRSPHRRAQNPEVLNRKVYWSTQRSPDRTVLHAALNHSNARILASLLQNSQSLAHGGTILPISHELSLPGPLTLFLPCDQGMKRVSSSCLRLLREQPQLVDIFTRIHVIRGRWELRDIIEASSAEMENLRGQQISLNISGKIHDCLRKVSLQGSQISHANLMCSNGIVHIIESPFQQLITT
ncbi:hypothetical protein IE077_001942, partial [Cardiosporidium cionae]